MVHGRCVIWQSVYTEPSCRGSTCLNVVHQILNTGKILVSLRKAVYVVILGVNYSICFVR